MGVHFRYLGVKDNSNYNITPIFLNNGSVQVVEQSILDIKV